MFTTNTNSCSHDISQHYPVQSTHNCVKQNKHHKRREQTHQKNFWFIHCSGLSSLRYSSLHLANSSVVFAPFGNAAFFVGEPLRQVHVPPGNVIASLPLTRSALPVVCLQPPPPLSLQ